MPKGKLVEFPVFSIRDCGNANDLGNIGWCPRKSYLFFLTFPKVLESLYVEVGQKEWQSTSLFDVSGAHRTILENPSET